MDKPAVYIETTVISYLAARPSNDPIVAAHQVITRRWWDRRSVDFELFTSLLVVREASQGDAEAAAKRMEFLQAIPVLAASAEADQLTASLLSESAMPASVPEDAAHVAIAATSGIDFLLTWNCRHLANAQLWRRIDEVIRGFGCEPPMICTPTTLLGDNADVD